MLKEGGRTINMEQPLMEGFPWADVPGGGLHPPPCNGSHELPGLDSLITPLRPRSQIYVPPPACTVPIRQPSYNQCGVPKVGETSHTVVHAFHLVQPGFLCCPTDPNTGGLTRPMVPHCLVQDSGNSQRSRAASWADDVADVGRGRVSKSLGVGG